MNRKTTDPSAPAVLVIGAGPVGMVITSELLQQGVDVRLIDRQAVLDEDDPHSKGILLWPRSLELLRRIGVSEQLVAAGHRSDAVGYFSDGRHLGSAHLDRHPDSPYNFVLTLPQRESERILRARLAELGGVVERGVALEAIEGVEDTGAAPVVTLRHPDGRTELVRPSWVVAADGPGSTTRNLLGISFEGEPIDVSYAIGDAPIHGDAPKDTGYYYAPDGVVALVPLAGGQYRIAANIPHRAEGEGNPPRELLEEIIRRRAKIDITVGEPLWTRSFRPRLGMASGFRRGRVFLAGDSGHAISPAGGQGMNVGFQDAANIAWKLAGVVNGRLDASILDSYEPERLASAQRMSATSAAQAKFAMQKSPARRLRRDAIFVAGRLVGVLQRVLVPLLSQTDTNYGDLDNRPLVLRRQALAKPGERLPLFAGPALPDGTPALDAYRHTVLLWPGRTAPADWAAQVGEARGLFAGQAEVLDLGGLSGHAARKLRRHLGKEPVLALVRPDGHLVERAAVSHAERLRYRLADLAPATTAGAAQPVTA
ncbi:FAD-dependent monooxygenase [Kitasatospora sp. NBC_01287]|uniref:FAD-dependent monooxygenase n=1 Tax=Kitasatospora sp. NBC_01287 TaxID=2903573 RepID=UPI00225B1380|nr:FAD-dependent monooxygenase [Kitasatospora sp. NBC_01287]MCX4747733.1 FAD-dependent monooxygenase [Kitasatospora sp. NBC_01287]